MAAVARKPVGPFLGQLAGIGEDYRLLRAIMNTAVDDGRVRRNPCRIKGAATEQRAERTTATVKQVYALAAAIGGRFRVFVLAAAFTGLRWGELIALRRMDGWLRTRSTATATMGRRVRGAGHLIAR